MYFGTTLFLISNKYGGCIYSQSRYTGNSNTPPINNYLTDENDNAITTEDLSPIEIE